VADFNTAVAITLQHEGGYVNNPADPGGATNMGIEQRDLPNIPIQTLTVAQATQYYFQNYWKNFYAQINFNTIASKLFDMGVLFGVQTSVMLLQQALNVTPADGIFGPNTLQSVNSHDPAMVMLAYRARLHEHEIGVGEAHPTDVVFEKGWSNRIDS
jgi:lysozyme family protein